MEQLARRNICLICFWWELEDFMIYIFYNPVKTGKDLIQQKVSFTGEEKKETKEFDFQDDGTVRSLLQ